MERPAGRNHSAIIGTQLRTWKKYFDTGRFSFLENISKPLASRHSAGNGYLRNPQISGGI